jgi:hypothetical protein
MELGKLLDTSVYRKVILLTKMKHIKDIWYKNMKLISTNPWRKSYAGSYDHGD